MVLLCASHGADCAEPAEQFLDGLLARSDYSTALEYLDWLEASKICPDEFRTVLDYHRGHVQLAAARSQKDVGSREKHLKQAEERYEAFLSRNARHALAPIANQNLRQLALERARGFMRDAGQPNADKDSLYRQAEKSFDAATKSYEEWIEQIRFDLQVARKGTSRSATSKRLRARFLEAKWMLALIRYEASSTSETDRRELQKKLLDADKLFEELSTEYRRALPGIMAVLYRGRIQQDLGKPKAALAFYEEHINEINQPEAVRNIAVQSTTRAIECWLDPGVEQFNRAIEIGNKWVNAAHQDDNSKPEWLALRMLLAKAYRAKAETIQGDQKSGLLANGRRQAEFVANYPGPLQARAQALAIELGGSAGPGTVQADSGAFGAARAAAIATRQELGNTDTILRLQTSQLASLTKAAAREALAKKLADTQKKRNGQSQNALQKHRDALELAGAGVPQDHIDDLRYYYCYLLYSSQRYYEAAVLGDFIARHHSNSIGARTAANIALASYATIQNEITNLSSAQPVTSSNPNLVAIRLEELADHIVRTWPGQKETDDALITLVTFMVRDGRYDKAEAYLKKIPAESPRRGDAEIRTGQSMWAAYIKQVTEDPSATDDQTPLQAEQLLTAGVERMKKLPPSDILVRGILSLAQVYLHTNQPQLAATLLEDPETGPKTLTDQNSPLITTTPGLAQQVYRTTLRAFIGSSATKKVGATMEALGKTVEDSPEGRRRLVSIYMALAKDLKTQIEMAPPNQRQSLTDSFDQFLGSVSTNTNEFNVLNWVATTYANMGDALGDAPKNKVAAARLYEKSAQGYERVLALQRNGELKLDENLVNSVRMQLATTRARLGNHTQAIATFTDILTTNNMMLNVQIEAARTLQAGALAGKTEWFQRSIVGDPPSGARRPTIWGWGKISKVTAAQMYKSDAAKQKFGGTFFEARLQMAKIQYAQSERADGDKKIKFLKSAEKILQSTASLYPELGGQKWKTEYNRLLATVQKTLGKADS